MPDPFDPTKKVEFKFVNATSDNQFRFFIPIPFTSTRLEAKVKNSNAKKNKCKKRQMLKNQKKLNKQMQKKQMQKQVQKADAKTDAKKQMLKCRS